YHFGQADNVFRPFVGVGYYQSSFSNETLADGSSSDIRLKDAKGVIGTVGVDMNINSTWFARADARYMRSRPDVKVGGEKIGEAKMDPWTVGFGIGARF
ncbi:OmpW family protein, partial [Pseudomonas aeruginosa]|nr:OmpW family protein [Pseudomonas aeruginosa]